LSVEAVDGESECRTKKSRSAFGDHRTTARRVQHNFDSACRAILLEADDCIDGPRQAGAELRDRNAGALTHAIGHLRVMRLEQNLHRAPSCLQCGGQM
jgi:hypothetical protein